MFSKMKWPQMKWVDIKITPFGLFIILLLVLISAVILQKWFPWIMPTVTKEGYISFYGSSTLDVSGIKIPQYSSSHSLLKLYDNLFFDPANGNIVTVDSSANNETPYTSATQDICGTSLSNMTVFSRTSGGTSNNVFSLSGSITTVTNSALVGGSIPCAYSPWSINNPYNRQYMTNWKLVYMPIGSDTTVMHIMDISNLTHLCSYVSVSGNIYQYPVGLTYPIMDSTNASFASIAGASSSKDASDNLLYIVSGYGTNPVYQLAHGTFFDVSHSCLFTLNASGGMINGAYNVANATIPATKINNTPGTFTTYGTSQKPIVYLNTANSTVVAIGVPGTAYTATCVLNNAGGAVNLQNVVYFNAGSAPTFINQSNFTRLCDTKKDLGGHHEWKKDGDKYEWKKDGDHPSESCVSGKYDISGSSLNDVIAQWYQYHPNVSANVYSNDYLLKTQVVPPVCPACPSCPSTGNCATCGQSGQVTGTDSKGNQVTGTLTPAPGAQVIGTDSKGNPIYGPGNAAYSANQAFADTMGVGQNSLGGQVNNFVNTTGGLGQTALADVGLLGETALVGTGALAVGGAGLVSQGVQGGANLLTQGVQGTVGLAKDTVSGTVGLAKDTVSGTVGLAKDVVSGISSLGQGAGANVHGADNQRNSYYNSPYTGGAYNTSGETNVTAYGPNVSVPTQGSTVSKTDPYSYYGAVPSKGGSNFMPVTADFSKFGR